MIRLILLVFSTLALSACSSVPKATFGKALPMPEDARPAPMLLTEVKYSLPTGSEVGSYGEMLCGLKTPMERGEVKSALVSEDLKDVFHDTLKSEGYDVAGNPDLLFDEEVESDLLRAEYRIGAEITDARTDVCYTEGRMALLGLPQMPGFSGQLYIKVRWHVFDALHRVTVWRTDTEGYAERSIPNPDGLKLLFNGAFEMAAHNLGADPDFKKLMVSGIRPPKNENDPKPKERPRQFDPAEKFTIQNKPPSSAPFTDHAETDRRAAVLVQGGAGHGSGFFIDGRGDILTNAHVVGDALHVRIVLAGREQAVVGEVVRSDKTRDVALVRPMDPVTVPAVLPIRAAWPGVGEKVYAIGAPRDTRLQDSVTSGIVSAWRKDFAMMGTRQDFIQSDVTVQPGNSGGPLLDANGNIVALADAGLMSNDNSTGLNYFIPIGEALSALGISLQ